MAFQITAKEKELILKHRKRKAKSGKQLLTFQAKPVVQKKLAKYFKDNKLDYDEGNGQRGLDFYEVTPPEGTTPEELFQEIASKFRGYIFKS